MMTRDRSNVQDSVYASLRKSIVNLNLVPGTVISEKEISLRYRVSRTPVREAFIHLSKEGLVRVIPQKETQVSRIDFARVEQERFLRENLELPALELFIEKYKPFHGAALEELIERQTEAHNNEEYAGFQHYDNCFHRIFFEGSGQELAWEVLESMGGHYHRVRLLSVWIKGTTKDIIGQHKKLFTAIKKKDFANARKLLESHVHKLDTEEALLREKYPDFFTDSRIKTSFDVDFGGLTFS